MPLQRHDLAPVDGFDNQIDWQPLLERWNQQATRWLLGPGFLSVHLAAFGLTFLTALTWNLIADPADLWMIEPFRIWGIVAVVHTVLLGGGLIVWKALNMGQPETRRFTVPALEAPRPRPEPARMANWQAAWSRGVESAARVTSPARRWASPQNRRAESAPPARDAQTGWPEQPVIFRATATDAQSTESPVTDVGEATWPGSAPLSTKLSGQPTSNPADEVVSVDHRDAGDAADDGARTWIDGFIESRSKDKEHRWSWVEAAAAAWLNRREVEGKSEKALPAETDAAAESAPAIDQDDPNRSQPPSA
jgi:hypothetical protein